MTKRGVDLGGEFRYLEPDYQGTLRANYLPDDRLRDRDRWGYALQARRHRRQRPAARRPLGLSLNLNRVSDDNYWRDFSRTVRLAHRSACWPTTARWHGAAATSRSRRAR